MDKRKAWNCAMSLIKVDGITPSKEFLDFIEEEIKGEITTEDMKVILDKKYRLKGKNALTGTEG